jgi:hypothetical protein
MWYENFRLCSASVIALFSAAMSGGGKRLNERRSNVVGNAPLRCPDVPLLDCGVLGGECESVAWLVGWSGSASTTVAFRGDAIVAVPATLARLRIFSRGEASGVVRGDSVGVAERGESLELLSLS